MKRSLEQVQKHEIWMNVFERILVLCGTHAQSAVKCIEEIKAPGRMRQDLLGGKSLVAVKVPSGSSHP